MPTIESDQEFGKSAFMALIGWNVGRLHWHEVRLDGGVYVREPDRGDVRLRGLGLANPKVAHPTGDFDAPALPFPFTVAQFLAFEKTAHVVAQMSDAEVTALAEETPLSYALAMAARHEEQLPGSSGTLIKNKVEDRKQRLERFRADGGDAKKRDGDWRFTGITQFAAHEKNSDTKRSDEKTVRADLKLAMNEEETSKQAGWGRGLGQRGV